jgi:hypothetical protein
VAYLDHPLDYQVKTIGPKNHQETLQERQEDSQHVIHLAFFGHICQHNEKREDP